jgi:hypothetical protein
MFPLCSGLDFHAFCVSFTRPKGQDKALLVGGRAWLPQRTGFAGEHCVQVFAGVGIVRLDSQSFKELPNCLLVAAFEVKGVPKVVVGEGEIRFQADGFLVLADRLLGLAFP